MPLGRPWDAPYDDPWDAHGCDVPWMPLGRPWDAPVMPHEQSPMRVNHAKHTEGEGSSLPGVEVGVGTIRVLGHGA